MTIPCRARPKPRQIQQSSELARPSQERIRQFFDAIGETLAGGDDDQLGVFDLTLRSFETMQNAIVAVKLAAYRPDVLIEAPRDACAAHEFRTSFTGHAS